MAEFAASLITLSEVGFRIGGALRDLIKTMKDAKDDIELIALSFESHTVTTRVLGEQVELYSKSYSLQVQEIHSILRKLIRYCQPIFDNIETRLKQFEAPVDGSASNVASRLNLRTRALWTRTKPMLEENLRTLGDIRAHLQTSMAVLQVDFSAHSNQQGSLL